MYPDVSSHNWWVKLILFYCRGIWIASKILEGKRKALITILYKLIGFIANPSNRFCKVLSWELNQFNLVWKTDVWILLLQGTGAMHFLLFPLLCRSRNPGLYTKDANEDGKKVWRKQSSQLSLSEKGNSMVLGPQAFRLLHMSQA